MTDAMRYLPRMATVSVLAAASTAAPAEDKTSAAALLAKLTGAHTRVVWCRQAGGQNARRRIVGFDSADGAGERVIVPKGSDYKGPHISADGSTVVLSDYAANKVLAVNWDGSGLRELASGMATDVWRDPQTKIQWVYVTPKLFDKWSSRPVRRIRLDRPQVSELVWDKTPISWGWFTLSADGRRAGGAFPWPFCGVAVLPKRDLRYRGGGCWPGIAPDNSYRLFVFTNDHRRLGIFDPDGSVWYLPLTGAPGVGGYSVHMPKWTNHVRFIVMAGPMRGGLRHSEIHVGRFHEKFRRIEKWVRLTYNGVADTYPDAWVEPGKGPQGGVVSVYRAPVATRPARGPSTWPGKSRDLVFLWEDGSKANRITVAGRDRVCVLEPTGMALNGRHFEMDLAGGAFVARQGGAAAVAAIKSAGALTVEALVTPKGPGKGVGRIVAFGLPAARAGSAAPKTRAARNARADFALSQRRDELVLTLRTSGGLSEVRLCSLTIGKANHVVVAYRPGNVRCYRNGRGISILEGIATL